MQSAGCVARAPPIRLQHTADARPAMPADGASASSAAAQLLAAYWAQCREAPAPRALPVPQASPYATAPMEAASVKRKRVKKMNRHKKRKLIKRERNKDRGA
jgi:hypothetical protein